MNSIYIGDRQLEPDEDFIELEEPLGDYSDEDPGEPNDPFED